MSTARTTPAPVSVPGVTLDVPQDLSSQAQFVQDATGNKSKLSLTAGGNVGVGTLSPQQPFQVGQYQAGAAGSVGIIRIAHTSHAGSAFKSWDIGVGNPVAGSTDPDAFSIRCVENQVNGPVVASSGKVGIGTPNPQQMLDVNGTIQAKGLIISGVASAATASGKNLKALSIDPTTGMLYYHE
jgi:hypothetical protein